MGECLILSLIFGTNIGFEIIVILYLKEIWDKICNKNKEEQE